MREMSTDEVRRFLLEAPRTAMMAVVRRDGRPHVTPIWFDLDGDDVVFTTGGAGVKAANLRRDPRVALGIDDQTPPYTFVMIEGTVTFSEDPVELRRWATRIGGRYMGADRAEEFGARNGVPPEILARMKVERIIARTGITD